ncbi:MAG: hypothetical protein WCK63_15890 [Betaproteobacteria bacterium]
MLDKNRQFFALITALIVLLFLCIASVQSADQSTVKPPPAVEKKELRISKDGKGIVDQNDKLIARFVKDIKMETTKGQTLSLQGCMCCTPECIIYDKNGNCIKTYNSCTWDFDCSCK